MPVIAANKPARSKGEKTILRMLRAIPGVELAEQAEAFSTKDQKGIDIDVKTNEKFFPHGDRKVQLQIKSPSRPEDVAEFNRKHWFKKIAVIQAAYASRYLHEFVRACLIFVLERPVKSIREQQKEPYIEAFKDKMLILHIHWAEKRIKGYKYVGQDVFVIWVGDDEFRLNWKSDHFLQKLEEEEKKTPT